VCFCVCILVRICLVLQLFLFRVLGLCGVFELDSDYLSALYGRINSIIIIFIFFISGLDIGYLMGNEPAKKNNENGLF